MSNAYRTLKKNTLTLKDVGLTVEYTWKERLNQFLVWCRLRKEPEYNRVLTEFEDNIISLRHNFTTQRVTQYIGKEKEVVTVATYYE